ncbi:hypothetical protein JG688_00016067 [Phytophthora aleatoria]|uniref:Jacalin-type lectin domain-containing protein n=1 Tax=Phytophthora aleatoria TaxID=2496075 RepID=A0A8J5ID27_9STRA|nr:hypothetical protein JG688_00016067 [Phytophthora aleatoria]
MRVVSRLLVAAVAVTVTSARSLGSASQSGFGSNEASYSGSGSLVDDDSMLNDESGSKTDLDDLFGSGFEAPSSSSGSNPDDLFGSSSKSDGSAQSDSASNEESAGSSSEATTASASLSASVFADVSGSGSSGSGSNGKINLNSVIDSTSGSQDAGASMSASGSWGGAFDNDTESNSASDSPVPAISVEDSVQLSESFASITIRSGERVDGVSLKIAAPTATTFSHGGTGGDSNTLSLGVGEYITSMEAHWGTKNDHTRIFYLSFGTSAGNTISGGTKTENNKSVTAPQGFQLGGFYGRGGDEIDLLGAIWTSISPRNIGKAKKIDSTEVLRQPSSTLHDNASDASDSYTEGSNYPLEGSQDSESPIQLAPTSSKTTHMPVSTKFEKPSKSLRGSFSSSGSDNTPFQQS